MLTLIIDVLVRSGRPGSLLTVDRVAGGGHPPPAPTERSVRISRTPLFAN